MFTTTHEEVSDDKYNAPTVADPVPSVVSTSARKKKSPPIVTKKIETETKPLPIRRAPSQPLPLYMINQEIRDSSIVFTLQVLNSEGEANTPFLELFLPLDVDVSPEIVLHTAVLRHIGRGKHTTLILER